jgi:uncharacterized protein YqjF (DUF2071 family)
VTRDGEPAVYFFSLDAQGILSVLGARIFHHLPYYYARIELNTEEGAVYFSSHRRHPGARPAQYNARYEPVGEQFSATTDPLARFIVERYRFYTEDQNGTLKYTDVDHEPWSLYDVDVSIESNTLFQANNFDTPSCDSIAYYSPGVNVTASRSQSKKK